MLKKIALCLAFLFIVYLPGNSLAHQLSVFAWVAGDTVHVEGRLPRGKRPRHGTVTVFDGGGNPLLEKAIGTDGTVTFPLRDWASGLKINLDIGNGHSNYWILTPYDIEQQRAK